MSDLELNKRTKPLFCDCGCNQIMGIDHGDKIVIKAKHHGKDHYLTVQRLIDSHSLSQAKQLIKRLAGSTN